MKPMQGYPAGPKCELGMTIIFRAFAWTTAVLIGLGFVARTAPAAATRKVAVVVGVQCTDLERYGANELCRYLDKLFNIKTVPTHEVPAEADYVLIIGSPQSNPVVAEGLGKDGWPQVSDQGIVLKQACCAGKPALVLGGGSPVATLWAVYDQVERWGVRYLLHGDVLPRNAGEFRLPTADVVLEPKFPVRQWRVVNDFACGPESWGIADYGPIFDQLAKLKFNRIYAVIYPWQPFLDLKFKGIERTKAWLWYDFHYPITDDMPGRAIFGDRREWWNPDLPYGASYREMALAGKRHLSSVLDYAKSRGMQIALSVNLAEFPKEFAPLLKDHRVIYPGLGELSVTPGPGQPIDDADLLNLSAAVLQTSVNTYPQVDFLVPGLPEIPHWTDGFQKAWEVLDGKYQLETRFPVQQMIKAAGNRNGYAGGLERSVQEVKSNIVALYIINRLFCEQKVLANSKRPDVRLMFNSMAEELLPVLPHVLPPGSETLNLLDYTPDRIAARPAGFKLSRGSAMRHNLIFTLHDDNVGLLPMLNTGSLANLAHHMRENGWSGFSTRYWLIGDHDPCVAFLAKRAWNDEVTPETVYRDQIEHACGPPAVPDLLAMFAELEAVTIKLNQKGMGLTFPAGRGMIEQHLKPEPMPAHLTEWREHYRRALAAARRALNKSTGDGKPYITYWIGRLELGEGYFNCAEAARHLATAKADLQQAEKLGNSERIAAKQDAARACAQAAVQTSRTMLDSFARVARDQSDRGTLAVMCEYVYRPLKEAADALK